MRDLLEMMVMCNLLTISFGGTKYLSYKVIYVEALIMSFVLMGTLLYFENQSVIRKRPALNRLYAVVMSLTVMDVIWAMIDGKPQYALFNRVLNIFDLTFLVLIGYCWFLALFEYLPLQDSRVYKYRFVASIPVFACFSLNIISAYFTGWTFSVSEAGVYSRGPIQWIPTVVDLMYMVLGTYYATKCKQAAQFSNDKNRFQALSRFPLPMYVLAIIQVFLPIGIPTVQYGILIGLIILYGSNQNNRVTRDHLTNLPNRFSFEQTLQKKIDQYNPKDPNKLFILEGDLNGFKAINDTYGHPEGDRALKLAAKVLEMNITTNGGNVARTGGDEFMAVLEVYEDKALNSILRNINKDLKTISKDTEYELSMSIGAYKYKKGTSFTDAISAADDKLYKIKKALKGD